MNIVFLNLFITLHSVYIDAIIMSVCMNLSVVKVLNAKL